MQRTVQRPKRNLVLIQNNPQNRIGATLIPDHSDIPTTYIESNMGQKVKPAFKKS